MALLSQNSHISSLLVYLRQIRQPYLSTAAAPSRHHQRSADKSSSSARPIYLSDAERAEIDTQTSTLLHDLSSNISSLTAAENLRTSTETALLERRFGKSNKRNNILWRWAAGDNDDDGDADDEGKSVEQLEAEGKANAIKVFREGVLWYLGWKLQGAVEMQRAMIEIRAAREREKEKSVLWKMKTGVNDPQVQKDGAVLGGGGGQIPRRTPGTDSAMNGDADYKLTDANHTYNPSLEEPSAYPDDSEAVSEDSLPPALLTTLQSENSHLLLRHYSSILSKIQQAESSLLEISSLQNTLMMHLSTQGEMIEQLVEDARGTDENVRRGNRELKRAGERWGKGLAEGTFWITVCVCGFLVGWDLVF